MRDLYNGTRQSITATWRTQLFDGHCYEIRVTSWIGRREKRPDGKGGYISRPAHVVFACATGDAVRMEVE